MGHVAGKGPGHIPGVVICSNDCAFHLSILLHEGMSSLMAYVGHRLHVIAEATLAQAAGGYWCWLAKQGGGLQWCRVSLRSTSACHMADGDCCQGV